MLTKQEKELLEECMDELYEDFATYQKTLQPGEQMNLTYQLFLSIIKKLDLTQPKLASPKPAAGARPGAADQKRPGQVKMKQGPKPHSGPGRSPSK